MHDRHGNGVSALRFAEPQAAEADLIDIAFVNNMPDKALEATERQFLRLVAASGKGLTVRIRFYFVPDIPRSEWGRHHVAASYAPIAELWNSRPDALIVFEGNSHAEAVRLWCRDFERLERPRRLRFAHKG